MNLELLAPEISLVFFSVLVIVLDRLFTQSWLAAVSVTGLRCLQGWLWGCG